MSRTFTALREHILTKRKSRKVADETMFGNGIGAIIYADHEVEQQRRQPWNGLLVIYTIVRIPFSILSSFSKRQGNIADRTWVTGHTMRTSEIDHLMVSDSMRYAICM
ncbi:hypothetical protein SOVF_068060 [Spinacia oleracea]|uniref:Uncharacterized protein n=1 Tax=Spinacia oleracea TaxID=3562 RepID=A0ABM3RUY9_SPIOL|nr:uncharacterized protein LOC130472448 [Spinacia oleracea]KNA18737.1 hypothetical protein SOVF_068060 [Spinacia oleracea]